MTRIRAGEALAAIGAIGLFLLLFADWFGVHGADAGLDRTGWSSLGWLLVALLVVEIALAVVLVAATVARLAPAVVVGSAVVTTAMGIFVLVVAVLRVLTQPGLGADLPNDAVTVELPAYLGLLALLAMVAGGWSTLADERTRATESAYTPPPARPAPGP